MKALSVCQPWAHLIVAGDKAVENRTWPTNYRGELLIHAGKSMAWWTPGLEFELGVARDNPIFWYGFIVGRCRLVDCVRVEEAKRRRLKYAEGPWCWLLEDRIHFSRPIPLRGALGIFNVNLEGLLADDLSRRIASGEPIFRGAGVR